MFAYPPEPLLTHHLLIRAAEETDLEGIYAVHREEAVNRYLPYTTWKDMEDASAWWQRVSERVDSGDTLQFVICERSSDKIIGDAVLFAYESEHQRAEIGYALGQDYWGRGLMAEALLCLLRYAFEYLELRRLDARVNSRNTASSALLQNLGFMAEGCLREWCLDEGELADELFFGLLRHEWEGAID